MHGSTSFDKYLKYKTKYLQLKSVSSSVPEKKMYRPPHLRRTGSTPFPNDQSQGNMITCIGLILGKKSDMISLLSEPHTPEGLSGDAAGWLVAIPVKSLLLVPVNHAEDDQIMASLRLGNYDFGQAYQKDISPNIAATQPIFTMNTINENRKRLMKNVIKDTDISIISNPARLKTGADSKYDVYNRDLRDILSHDGTNVIFTKIDTIPYQLGVIDAYYPGLYILINARYDWDEQTGYHNGHATSSIVFDLPGGKYDNCEPQDRTTNHTFRGNEFHNYCIEREYREETGKDITANHYRKFHECIDTHVVPRTSYNYYSYVHDVQSTQHTMNIDSRMVNTFFDNFFENWATRNYYTSQILARQILLH